MDIIDKSYSVMDIKMSLKMESCIVCLECNEDCFSRISTLSSEWIDCKMQRIIEKHLWWWYLKSPATKNGVDEWICRHCWEEISGFHQFYSKVEKAHRYQTIVSLQQMTTKFVKLEDANERLEPRNTELLLFKDRFKVISQNQRNNMENFEENAIDIMDIKTEVCIGSPVPLPNVSFANENSLEEGSHKYIENGYCNAMKIEQDNPLTNESKTKFPNKTSAKIKDDRSERKTGVQTKGTKSKQNFVFDNFFKETGHKLECCICSETMSEFRSLKAHYRSNHNTPGYAICCGKKFFKRCVLVDHLRVHADPNFFKCQICTKTFATRYVFEVHLETHKSRERKYNCDVCGKSYFKLHIFERHKLTHVPENEKHFNCSQCHKKFATDSIRRYHEDSTHAKKYVKICDICGKSFHHSRSFKLHMKEHSGISSSVQNCDLCDAKLTNKKELRKHIKLHHRKENQEHTCPYCSRVSKNYNAHRMHIKYAHTMQRKHSCHLCDKAFKRPLELKEHLSTHTGEALYNCPHCSRTFISNANMYKHRRTAHPLECEQNRVIKE